MPGWMARIAAPLRTLTLSLMSAFALAACVHGDGAGLESNTEREPEYYVCESRTAGEFGSIWYTIEVLVDGSVPYHRVNWSSRRLGEGVELHLQWLDRGPFTQASGRAADVWVSLRTRVRPAQPARLEVRSRTDPSRLIFAGAVAQSPRGALSTFQMEAHWSDLQAWLGKGDAVLLALTQRDGTVVQWELLSASTIVGLDRAIAIARPQAESKAVNYRRDCEVPQPIIVT